MRAAAHPCCPHPTAPCQCLAKLVLQSGLNQIKGLALNTLELIFKKSAALHRSHQEPMGWRCPGAEAPAPAQCCMPHPKLSPVVLRCNLASQMTDFFRPGGANYWSEGATEEQFLSCLLAGTKGVRSSVSAST